MSYVKVEINQAKDRQVYYAKGIDQLKVTPDVPVEVLWYDNDEYMGQCATKVHLPKDAVGEFKLRIYIINGRDKHNQTNLTVGGPFPVAIDASPNWKQPVSIYHWQLHKLHHVASFVEVHIVADGDRPDTFSCDELVMMIEQV